MRFILVKKPGEDFSSFISTLKASGAKNLREFPGVSQAACDLEESQAEALRRRGYSVKRVEPVKPAKPAWIPGQYISPQRAGPYSAWQSQAASWMWNLRNIIRPPVTGEGTTICILDSGIRETHTTLEGKIAHGKNFTDSPTLEDKFGHGTPIAFLAAGGRHALSEESGIAPGSWLWNIKVINDLGISNVEWVVAGIDEVVMRRKEARERGIPEQDPMFPNIINLSLGVPDDGDPNHPLRVACREFTRIEGGVVAACGNNGPSPTTITCPATDPEVFAVGTVLFVPWGIWEYSSRGPTKEGYVKPDVVFYGVNLLAASHESDTSFRVVTGGSFSTPQICGLAALGQELVYRLFGFRVGVKQTFEFLPRICRKPPNIPPQKDNSYGWGMPLGNLVAEEVSRRLRHPARYAAEALGVALPILMMGRLIKEVRY